MTIQTDLRTVTDRITTARANVAAAEVDRLRRRMTLTEAETAHDTARRILMARSDAGTNDAARRAYAERETAAERERLADTAAELLDVEAALINMKCELAQATDRRRLLETLVSLAATGPNAPIQPAYYTGPDGDPFARAEVEVEVAA